MKELSIEQKAKCYDEALERAKGVIEQNPLMEYLKKGIEYIFPVLKENEDEEIKGAIIHFISHTPAVPKGVIDKETMLAWLEKQGEHKPQGKSALEAIKEEKVDNRNYIKPTDRVEPKFKVNDWVVNKFSNVWRIDIINNKNYHVSNGDKYSYFPIEKQDEMHPWTIEDAKDGDVLYSNCLRILWIFKGRDTVYCGCNLNYNDGAFSGEGHIETPTDAIPATKEQRDLLFKKMNEAGYEWDAEKKELKKIEQIPAMWIEEYETYSDHVITAIKSYYTDYKGKENPWREELLRWFKSLRPQNNITDEELVQAKKDAYNDALNKIEYHSGEPTFDDGWSAAIWYLKKRNTMPQRQWKPSEEQMEALHYVTNFDYGGHKAMLISLYEQLKKL